MDRAQALQLMVPAFREQTGREGLARAMARLVPAAAQEVLDLLLDGTDAGQRAAVVEVLGERGEPELQPALQKACGDPVEDIAERARFFLGRLPGAELLVRTLLHAAAPADFQLGLQLVAEHRYPALVPDLLELMHAAGREELVLQLIHALGRVGPAAAERAGEPLLTMLHSGQSLRLQTALAEALGAMARLDLARALCAKADEIKQPAVNALAVEALAAVSAAGPLPADLAPLLLEQTRAAWRDRNPWPVRLRLAQVLPAVVLEAPRAWLALADLVNEALGEKRSPSAWTPDELRQVQLAAKEFARRGAGG
jgi:HEAT repeat protein